MSPSNGDSSDEGASNSSKASPSQGSAAGENSGARRKGREVTVSRETLIKRVTDAQRTSMVVLAFRATGGALITLFFSAIVTGFLSILPALGFLEVRFLYVLFSMGVAVVVVIAARFATITTMPEAASALGFLDDRVFVWADPFREDRPHLLPMWLEAILWAPNQVLAGAVPLLRIRTTGPADVEAASDVARRMVENSEIDLTEGFAADSAEARGLRLLLLLRLARLTVEDGRLKGRVSGLGQAALFEGAVG